MNFITENSEESKENIKEGNKRKDLGVALGKSGYIGQPDYWGADGKGSRIKRIPYQERKVNFDPKDSIHIEKNSILFDRFKYKAVDGPW